MPHYKIVGEEHEGVFSCDEEVLATISANNSEDALRQFASENPHVIWEKNWGCYLLGVRKIFAVRVLELDKS